MRSILTRLEESLDLERHTRSILEMTEGRTDTDMKRVHADCSVESLDVAKALSVQILRGLKRGPQASERAGIPV